MRETKIECCHEMAQAQEVGTDNEGYGRAVWFIGPHRAWRIGSRMGDIAFCPWCGKKVS